MSQTFDMTFCCHGDCTNDKCERFMQPETLAEWPPYRGVSCADFKTPDCGYEVKNENVLMERENNTLSEKAPIQKI